MTGEDGVGVGEGGGSSRASRRRVRDTLWTWSPARCAVRGEPSGVHSPPSGGEKERDDVLHFLAVSATLLKNLNRPPKWPPLLSECLGMAVGWKSRTDSKSTDPYSESRVLSRVWSSESKLLSE